MQLYFGENLADALCKINTLEWQTYSRCVSFCNLVLKLRGLGEVMIKWTEGDPDLAKMTEISLTVLN